MTTSKALSKVLFWVGLALLFNLGIYFFMGSQKAAEFFGGYIIEQSLSMDNLFLFLLIFGSFGIDQKYQSRVLNYGIIGAVILRLIFVLLGVAVVNRFHWLLYVFGFILIISGIKMMLKSEKNDNFKNSPFIKLLKKIMPVTEQLEGEKFLVRKNGVLYATPLLAILVLIEGSDIIFAIDSIPAIFSITTDPFIVYTSNIFAVMGLRSMYFLLEKLHKSFEYVKYGVALILVFTGIKLSVLFFHIEIPLLVSIAVIFSILLLSIGVSALSKYKFGIKLADG
jgi:tellurite resistance protein TerC